MKPWRLIACSALFWGVVAPLVLGRHVGVLPAVVLGLLAGGLGAAGQYAIWGDDWRATARAWRTGPAAQRRSRVRASARRTLLGTAAYVALVALVLAAVWLSDGSRPGAQALLLFLPALLMLASYAHSRWYERRVK
jgi:hypothetical protein